MCNCLSRRKLRPVIAFPGTIWSIPTGSQNWLFAQIKLCKAMLAVSAQGSSSRRKFIKEIEWAGDDPYIPVVSFLMKGSFSTPIHHAPILYTTEGRVEFDAGQHIRTCGLVNETLRDQIALRRSNIVSEETDLPRRRYP